MKLRRSLPKHRNFNLFRFNHNLSPGHHLNLICTRLEDRIRLYTHLTQYRDPIVIRFNVLQCFIILFFYMSVLTTRTVRIVL